MPPRVFNGVIYTPTGKPNLSWNRRQPRSLSNLKPGNHLKRRLLAVLDLRAAQAEAGCPSRAGASMSGAGLREAPQSRHKTHSQFLPRGLLVSCLDGTAHSRGLLTARESPKGTRKTPQTSNDKDKDQFASQCSAETSYKSPAVLCRTIPQGPAEPQPQASNPGSKQGPQPNPHHTGPRRPPTDTDRGPPKMVTCGEQNLTPEVNF